jgi:glycerate 2-kinase
LRVLVAPKALYEGPGPHRVAEAIAAGIRDAGGNNHVVELPLADGGEGTFDVLAALLETDRMPVQVHDLHRRDQVAHVGISSRGVAIIEMTHAAGSHLVPRGERDALTASTFGVGQLVAQALEWGARRIVLGAGGSGTIDAGAGALAALGTRFLDSSGVELHPTPSGLANLTDIDLRGLDRRLVEVPLTVLADTVVPLADNARVYGADKGLSPHAAGPIEQVLSRIERLAAARGRPILNGPWVGAGGGLAGGLYAFAGARVAPGARALMRLAGFDRLVRTVDLVFTAGGRVDQETFVGKLPYVVTHAAAEIGVPAVLLRSASALEPPTLAASIHHEEVGHGDADDERALESLREAAERIVRARY